MDNSELVRTIASIIDHPSVYMGGPSAHAIRLADRIIKYMKANDLLKEIA